jgi:4-hydroxy-2-oxoheptanedioate aldolase
MQMYTHDPDLIEIVGYTGFDFVMIEHGTQPDQPETMVHLIRAAEVSGLTPLVRVGANDVFSDPLGGESVPKASSCRM